MFESHLQQPLMLSLSEEANWGEFKLESFLGALHFPYNLRDLAAQITSACTGVVLIRLNSMAPMRGFLCAVVISIIMSQ